MMLQVSDALPDEGSQEPLLIGEDPPPGAQAPPQGPGQRAHPVAALQDCHPMLAVESVPEGFRTLQASEIGWQPPHRS